jgi:murein DD-endopeptidase MepM/ murein hydrolase activator NlpD
MTAVLRVFAIAGSAALLWSFAVSKVVDQARLPASDIVPGAIITQPFGCTTLVLEPFDPLCPSRHVHTGVDLAAPAGTPVHAATGGVAHVGYDSGAAGLYVVVDFGDRVRILYCHLFSNAVQSGEEVAAGQTIGTVGSSGLATGPHLHFEVQVNGRSVDPLLWLAADGGS